MTWSRSCGNCTDTSQLFPKKSREVLEFPFNPRRSQNLAYTLKKASPG